MARIAGVNIPTGKRVVIALTYIHGIGRTSAATICEKNDIPAERRVFDLTDDELGRIRDTIDQDYQVEGDLRREHSMNVTRLQAHDVNLIEGVTRFSLALENNIPAILREIPLPTPASLQRQLPHTLEKLRLTLGLFSPAQIQRNQYQANPQCSYYLHRIIKIDPNARVFIQDLGTATS